MLTDTGIRAIRGYPKRIQSYNEARSIRGVGDKTALKVRTFHPQLYQFDSSPNLG